MINFPPSDVVSVSPRPQVNQSLRSFGGLTRNDVQCMLSQHPDGLPDTIRSGINTKVDQLLKVGVAFLIGAWFHSNDIIRCTAQS